MTDPARPVVTISLQDLTGLAHRQLRAADEVAKADAALALAKAKHAYIEQELMPAALRELGMAEFKLEDGRMLKLTADVSCKIPDARLDEAVEWLKAHEWEAVIKNLIVTEFGKGEEEMAEHMKKALRQALLEYATEHNEPVESLLEKVMQKKFVHPQTLKKVMRDSMAVGVLPPEDVFGLWSYEQVKITVPK